MEGGRGYHHGPGSWSGKGRGASSRLACVAAHVVSAAFPGVFL